jgi:hypothetical protein
VKPKYIIDELTYSLTRWNDLKFDLVAEAMPHLFKKSNQILNY